MWQRKQTIFLALSAACMILMIFFPAWLAIDNGVEKMLYPLHYTIKTDGIRNTIYFPYALSAILAVAAATLSIFEITKYENRMLQIKLGALNSLVMAGSLMALVWFATQLIKSNQIAGEYGLSLWMPAGAMVSNMIANRFIRRDEKLVRDSDRIR
jgi:hypothetical protein